jgi:dihydroorotate dehydrogenase
VYSALMRLVVRHVDAERAHRVGVALMRLAVLIAPLRIALTRLWAPPEACAVDVLGLRLRSPLGVAAGFDKNARAVRALVMLGFGYVEIGTVTARPQPGNPKPRLFRLPADQALVNRMGFNNDGAEVIAGRLRALRREPDGARAIVGVNIGRSKLAEPHETVDDYCTSARLLAPLADYLTINISSPNTPGLRDLHAVDQLRPLLVAVRAACDAACAAAGSPRRERVPILLKISPDLADADVVAIRRLVGELGIDGVIATNTTVTRDGLRTSPEAVAATGAGGLSGAPLAGRAREVQALLSSTPTDGLVLVASGGVMTPADGAARLAAGAALVQAYTGFIYGGPAWAAHVNRAIAAQRSTV